MDSERVFCIDNEGYPVALELFATYETVADEQAEKRGLIRVIDESGEDYLYPKSRFVSADITHDIYASLSGEAKEALEKRARLAGINVNPLTGRGFSTHA
jgi:hypothetical protein